MVHLRAVASSALGLARSGAMPLLGVAILLGIFSPHEAAPPGDLRESAPKTVLAQDDDGILRVTLGLPKGKAYSGCVVRNEEGMELMSFHYSANGSLYFHLAESPTVGATGYRYANGEFGFRVGGEGLEFEYAGRPQRSPFVELASHVAQRHARYRVTPEGSLILQPEPPAK